MAADIAPKWSWASSHLAGAKRLWWTVKKWGFYGVFIRVFIMFYRELWWIYAMKIHQQLWVSWKHEYVNDEFLLFGIFGLVHVHGVNSHLQWSWEHYDEEHDDKALTTRGVPTPSLGQICWSARNLGHSSDCAEIDVTRTWESIGSTYYYINQWYIHIYLILFTLLIITL